MNILWSVLAKPDVSKPLISSPTLTVSDGMVITPCTQTEMEEDLSLLESSTSLVADDEEDCIILDEAEEQEHVHQNPSSFLPVHPNSLLCQRLPADYQASKHTIRKTRAHVQLFQRFLESQGEMRLVENIPPCDLDPLLGSFLSQVQKDNGEDYEPAYLKNIQSSLERYLKFRGYAWSIVRNAEFASSRKKLMSKVEELIEQGKGVGVPRWGILTDQDVDTFYQQGQLGTSTPDSLLNTLWFMVSLHFGPMVLRDHSDMQFGDIELQRDGQDKEFLIYTRNRTQHPCGKTIVLACSENPSRCFVHVYKTYYQLRPPAMLSRDSPFYLQVNPYANLNNIHTWFRPAPCGQLRLAYLMKRMAEACGITDRKLTNNSLSSYIFLKKSRSTLFPLPPISSVLVQPGNS